jgi:hypothetical protein
MAGACVLSAGGGDRRLVGHCWRQFVAPPRARCSRDDRGRRSGAVTAAGSRARSFAVAGQALDRGAAVRQPRRQSGVDAGRVLARRSGWLRSAPPRSVHHPGPVALGCTGNLDPVPRIGRPGTGDRQHGDHRFVRVSGNRENNRAGSILDDLLLAACVPRRRQVGVANDQTGNGAWKRHASVRSVRCRMPSPRQAHVWFPARRYPRR